MKTLVLILAALFAPLHPVAASAVILAALGVLSALITRSALGRVYPCPWRLA